MTLSWVMLIKQNLLVDASNNDSGTQRMSWYYFHGNNLIHISLMKTKQDAFTVPSV